jgi:hypothetical protein
MKKILLFMVFAIAAGSLVHAQDVIVRTDGEEIKAKVVEVGTTDVKYKKYGNESGPNYSLSKSKIFMIKYENGDRDVITPAEAKAEPTRVTAAPTRQTVVRQQTASQPVVAQPERSQPVAPTSYSGPGQTVAYAGILIGGGTLLEDYSNVENGFHYSVNLGYLFGRHFGMHSSFFGSTYSLTNKSSSSIGLSGILVGPLFSFPTEGNGFAFDLRPGIGLGQGNVSSGKTSGRTDTSFVAGFGTTARWKLADSFALSANVDITSGSADEVDMSSICLTIGFLWVF